MLTVRLHGSPRRTFPLHGGMIQLWGVRESYRVRGNCLLASGEETRGYDPMAEPELPIQLALVNEAKLSPKQFASKFGLLGYDQLLWLASGRIGTPSGDPLDWFKAHARTVFHAMELLTALAEDDMTALTEVVTHLPEAPYGFLSKTETLDYSWLSDSLRFAVKQHQRMGTGVKLFEIVKAQTKTILSHWINRNIAQVRRELLLRSDRRAESIFRFDALIECIYWHLANRLEQGGLHRCHQCRRFFFSRDPRLKFCPPPKGVKRSRCASLFHVSKHRQRNKNTTEGSVSDEKRARNLGSH